MNSVEGNALVLLLTLGAWTVGGWLLAGHAFSVYRHERLARVSRRHALGAGAAALATPFLMALCAVNNLAALGLDRLNIDTERFSPNLWVVFTK